MNTNLTKALNQVLADSYALYLKTQNYHWHVTGPSFASLHSLFETQYTDLAEAIDEIAERIRILGAQAAASFTELQQLKTISDGDANLDATSMIKDLHDSQKVMIASLQIALEAAQDQQNEGTIGLIVQRMEIHEKNGWMLGASL